MVRIASSQLRPADDLEARMAQIKAILAKAQAMSVDFICFPEGALTGYYADENVARESSLEVGEPLFEEWLHAIKEASPYVTVIVGFNERDGEAIFDSAAIIENGALLGVQRKHYLYHDYFTPGSSSNDGKETHSFRDGSPCRHRMNSAKRFSTGRLGVKNSF